MKNLKQDKLKTGVRNLLPKSKIELMTHSKECKLTVGQILFPDNKEINKLSCPEILNHQKTELDNPSNTKNLLSTKWLYTRKEVAYIFSVSLVTLHNWKIRSVLTPLPPVGGKIFYSRKIILEVINQNSNKTNNYESTRN